MPSFSHLNSVERLTIFPADCSWVAIEMGQTIATGLWTLDLTPPPAFQTHWDLHVEPARRPTIFGSQAGSCQLALAEPFLGFALRLTDDFYQTWRGKPQAPTNVVAALVALILDRRTRNHPLIPVYPSYVCWSSWNIQIS